MKKYPIEDEKQTEQLDEVLKFYFWQENVEYVRKWMTGQKNGNNKIQCRQM